MPRDQPRFGEPRAGFYTADAFASRRQTAHKMLDEATGWLLAVIYNDLGLGDSTLTAGPDELAALLQYISGSESQLIGTLYQLREQISGEPRPVEGQQAVFVVKVDIEPEGRAPEGDEIARAIGETMMGSHGVSAVRVSQVV